MSVDALSFFLGAAGAVTAGWGALRLRRERARLAGGVYETALADAVPGAWLRLDALPGRELMIHALTTNSVDLAAGVVLARMSATRAESWAKSLGGRLPTRDELERAARDPRATVLAACNLVFSADDEKRMQSREFAAKHDACARKKFGEQAFPGSAAVFFTKTWCDHADLPSTRAREWGFWAKPGDPSSLIQKDGGAHDRAWVDYAMVPSVIRDRR